VWRAVRAFLLVHYKPLQPTRAPHPISVGQVQVDRERCNDNGKCLIHGESPCEFRFGHGLKFLDELTTGLDPQSRRAIWDLVRGIRDRGS